MDSGGHEFMMFTIIATVERGKRFYAMRAQ